MLERLAIGLLRATKWLPRGHTRLAFALPSLVPSLRNHRLDTRYGPMICDMSEEICHPLFIHGEYPHWRAEENWLCRLHLDGIVLDIGANIGAMTMQFARRAKHIHAFEPSPRALRLLRLNAPANCTVYPFALGDKNGCANLMEAASTDASQISDQGIPIEIRTLDSFALEPDFIKIDVEGHEPAVLKGAKATLERGPTIMFEALNSDALAICKAVIREANSAYRFITMGGDNYIATTKDL